MNVYQLAEARAKSYAGMQSVLAGAEGQNRDLTTAEVREFDRYQREVADLSAKIDAAGGIPRHSDDGIVARTSGSLDNAEWRDGSGRGVRVLKPEQRLASLVQDEPESRISFDRFVRGIVTGNWEGVDPEQRAMSIGTPTAGGYLVPAALSARVIDKARNAARIFQAGAQTVPMESSTLKLARVVGDPTAAWKVENAQATASDMTLDSVDLTARTLMSIVKSSVELVEDAEGVDGVIENALSAALALELDRAALRGAGTPPEPRGVRNTSGVGIQSMGANGATATYAAISSAVQTVREANGEPNAAIIAPRTAGTFDRLVDSTGQPLRPPTSFEDLDILTTAQLPVNLTQGSSTDTSEVYVGQWNELLIGVRTNLTIEVSRQASTGGESAFDRLQVHIRAYLRADVGVAQPSHFVVVTGVRP